MQHKEFEYLLKQIERRYGDINNNGCYINGRWLSVAAIVNLVKQADKEC